MEDSIPKIPNLDLAQDLFILQSGPDSMKEDAKQHLLQGIKDDGMHTFYLHVVEELGWTLDEAFAIELKEKNDQELKQLSDKLEDAEKNLGETEISDALIGQANFYSRIGNKAKALPAFQTALEKTGPLGFRIDIIFSIIRVGFFFHDNDLISKNIEKAKLLIEEGGDWDRRNRLKVYEGIYKISIRNFKEAVTLLHDTLATFTSTELMEYKDFVKYTVLTSTLTLKRPEFKQKVIDAPEILEVIHEIPDMKDYATSFYNCQYAQIFKSLAAIEQTIKIDRILNAHYRYYVREMRISVYAQLLESYRSLTIASMARSFGVSVEWIDSDLSKYIAAGRLNAVIDKVEGIVETNRPDAKNAQYQATIKQGDALLNRIQKLSRVINV